MSSAHFIILLCLAVAFLACFYVFALAHRESRRRTANAEIVAFLSSFAAESAKTGNFSGVVLYARDKTVLFHKAYGIANRETGELNKTTTRFNLAPASKMFTAVVTGKLVEEGLLSFDNPIGKYLGCDWVSAEVGGKA